MNKGVVVNMWGDTGLSDQFHHTTPKLIVLGGGKVKLLTVQGVALEYFSLYLLHSPGMNVG